MKIGQIVISNIIFIIPCANKIMLLYSIHFESSRSWHITKQLCHAHFVSKKKSEKLKRRICLARPCRCLVLSQYNAPELPLSN